MKKYQGWATDGWNSLLFETCREHLTAGDTIEYKGKRWMITSILKNAVDFAINID